MTERIIENLGRVIKEKTDYNHFDSEMAPKTPEKFRNATAHAHPAAVLIGLFQKPNDEGFFFHLIKRKVSKNDRHSGQISLPGGRLDPSDNNLEECALRENEEEIGIPTKSVKIIGKLTDMYVYASNHIVSPFVGHITEPLKLRIDPTEVDRAIEVSVSNLLMKDTQRYKDITVREGTIKKAPYYNVQNEIVWGATAMILNEFIDYWKVI